MEKSSSSASDGTLISGIFQCKFIHFIYVYITWDFFLSWAFPFSSFLFLCLKSYEFSFILDFWVFFTSFYWWSVISQIRFFFFPNPKFSGILKVEEKQKSATSLSYVAYHFCTNGMAVTTATGVTHPLGFPFFFVFFGFCFLYISKKQEINTKNKNSILLLKFRLGMAFFFWILLSLLAQLVQRGEKKERKRCSLSKWIHNTSL